MKTMIPTDEQREYNEYLLEHFRRSGLFKCTECIYRKEEETPYGLVYKCWHDGTFVHQASKNRNDVMLGCACFWFEPRANAGVEAGARKRETERLLSVLWEFAWSKVTQTPLENSADEKHLERIRKELFKIGVRP